MGALSPESRDRPRRIDLTRSQQWVLHQVLVARCDRAWSDRRTPPWWTVDAVERVEDGVLAFRPFEARRIRADVAEFAHDAETPAEDARAAVAIVEELERTFPDAATRTPD